MNQQAYQIIKDHLGPLRVFENEPLSKHTYFKIGGPAKLYFEAKTTDDLVSAIKIAIQTKTPFVVLGSGANVLVSDYGFNGLLIKNKSTKVALVGLKGTYTKQGKGIKNALISASSGTLMNQLARFTLDQGLEGLEFLLSVPGTVGGGLKINAHFKVEKNEFIGNRLVSASLINPKNGQMTNVDQPYFDFSYDFSKIQKAMENVKRRNEEQPIGVACSGCIFQNISDVDAKRIMTPNLTTSAGYIIQSLNLKGTKVGDAQISEKHANFILNIGTATATNVLKLINLVKEKARNTYGINLKEEIFYIGDFDVN